MLNCSPFRPPTGFTPTQLSPLSVLIRPWFVNNLTLRKLLLSLVSVSAAAAILWLTLVAPNAASKPNGRAASRLSANLTTPEAPPAGATYHWAPPIAGVNDWTVPTNWTPWRLTPATDDILIIDPGFTPTLTNIPNQTIGALSISNTTDAKFQAGADGNTLTISGGASALQIASGSSITFDGANASKISVASGSTGSVSGNVILQGGAHKLLAADVASVTFASGSIFTASTGFTGNPFGTGTDGSVVFQSGSSAFFNAGSDPFGGSGHAIANFNLGSSQTFNSLSAFASDGRTYGNLTLDGSQTYSGSGSGLLTIFNALNIVSGSTLTLSGSPGGDLNLLGDIAVNGTLTTNGRTVRFQGGSATQNITTSATFGDVSISKTGGTVKLGGALTVNGALQFDGSGSAVDVLEFNQNTLNLNGTIGGSSASTSNGFKGDAAGATLNIGGTGALGTLKFVSGSQSLKSLSVNRTVSGAATLGSPLAVANTLTLTSGLVTTTSSNLLAVTNSATNAISGGASSSYINGPLARALPASLGTGSTYSFPVGKGTFNPFDLLNPTTSVSVTIQAEVFDASAGGTAGSGLSSLNTNRYWSAAVMAGSFTSTAVRLTDSGVSSSSRIGKSSAVSGTYDSIGGTVSGSTITSNPITSLSFFNIGTISCPASFIVNDNGDTSDANPGDAVCADANGKCTLRAAIQEANADTGCGGAIEINFNISTPNTINLGSVIPDINHSININGAGAPQLTVQRSTGGNYRIFNVLTTGVVSFAGLTISNGFASGSGGGINNSSAGTVNVTNCILNGNGSPTAGGGINNDSNGTVNVTSSTLNANFTGSAGGGLTNRGTGVVNIVNSTISASLAAAGGGIYNITSGGTVNVINSTVTGNSASLGGGGGINNNPGAILNVINSTISGNSGVQGGGIRNSSSGTINLTNSTITGNSGGGVFNLGGPVFMRNTIVAGNNTTSTGPDLNGNFTSQGSNLIGKSDGGSGFTNGVNGDKVGTIASPIDPLLGALSNNGGATQTHALLPGSPAINAGSNANLPADTFDLDGDSNTAEPLPVDQRGVGFSRVVNGTVDIGAFESRGFTIQPTGGTPQSATITTAFGAPLIATVTSSAGEPVAGGLVTFTTPASGPSGSFAGGLLTVTVTTNSGGVASAPPLTANAVAGPFNVTATTTAANPAIFPLTNSPASTSTSVNSSVNPSEVGQTILFTASVTATAGTPTGTVQFKDGPNVLGNASCFVSASNGCAAQLPISSLTPGTHVISANYSDPNNNYLGSSGNLAGGQLVGSLVRFEVSNYTVNESDGFVTVKVIRTGALNNSVSVSYGTDDTGAPSSCGTFNSLASSRCDFTTALGTLQFNPGETEKLVTVLVNRDSYAEGAESFTIGLSNLIGAATFASPTTTTITINDSPAIGSNAIDDSTNFVRQHYHDFLNREPDASGLQFWANEIESCGADARCREVKRINVSGAFFLSIEFQQTGYLVERLYKTAYGDATGNSTLGTNRTLAVPIVRLDEFLADSQKIGQGVIVGQGNWQQQLDNNKKAFIAEFVQRSRFVNAYAGMDALPFVFALNRNAGKPQNDY